METGKGNVVEGYELRPALRKFAEEMERVMRENDYKHGVSTDRLFHKMVGETYELHSALNQVNLRKPELTPWLTRDRAIKEAVDVANYAMMIAKSIWW